MTKQLTIDLHMSHQGSHSPYKVHQSISPDHDISP